MSSRTEAACSKTVQYIWQAFLYGLKEKQLLTKIPEFYAMTTHLMTFQLIHTIEMPTPPKKIVGEQDPDPVNISLEANANFRVQPQQQQLCPSQVQQQSIIAEAIKTKRTRRSISKHSATGSTGVGVFALSEAILSEKQLQLQQEIEQVKKRLYFARKLRKENEEEERRRMEEHMNRKAQELPSKQFSFDYSGDILVKQQSPLARHLVCLTGGRSLDAEENKKKKVLQNTEEESRDYLVSRGASSSREGKRLLFANMNKRQVSHLPFIKLNQSVKMSQNHRTAMGPDSSRFTLKSYQSRGQSSFRHHAQIEKQRAERLYSLKRSSQVSEITEDQVQAIPVIFQQKKQSKRMQKYLRKLCEDRNKDFISQINKSSNFDRLNSPHDYSVHRYYRHDFDIDKRSICESSLASLKINTSFFKQVKFTQ